jgi:hypothetical protein
MHTTENVKHWHHSMPCLSFGYPNLFLPLCFVYPSLFFARSGRRVVIAWYNVV